MYLRHFALTRLPFETPAHTDELFESNARREAEARLQHLIELKGIGLLTGEVGSGKTTVCRHVAAALHPGLYRVGYLSLTTGNVLDMYKSIAWELGLPSKCTAQLLADLGVTRSLSRPQVSDDNPFSEAQFKTLKYHPGFPRRFDDIHAAIAFCRSFFPWYNTEHRHGGIAMLTPDDVHHGRAHTVLQQREQTLRAAWNHHPERFDRGIPKPLPLPEAVWIIPPATSTTGETAQ